MEAYFWNYILIYMHFSSVFIAFLSSFHPSTSHKKEQKNISRCMKFPTLCDASSYTGKFPSASSRKRVLEALPVSFLPSAGSTGIVEHFGSSPNNMSQENHRNIGKILRFPINALLIRLQFPSLCLRKKKHGKTVYSMKASKTLEKIHENGRVFGFFEWGISIA